jgi:hypothetical protein
MYGNSYISIDGHAEIPAGVDKIATKAFKDINQLKSVSIPDTVTVIQSYAFAGCSSLTTVIIPDSVKKISGKCFEGCSGLTKVVLPKGIKEIEDYVFSGCSSLQEIVIPDSVRSIGRGAFSRCTSLAKVVLPKNLVSIGNLAERHYEDGPFERCGNLSNLVFPEGVRTIGDRAFSECGLGSVILPDSLENIGNDAFYRCPLSKVDIPANVKVIKGFRSTSITQVNLPEGLVGIGESAFERCSSLLSLTVPDGVREIGKRAFCGCSSLKTLNLPKVMTELGDEAFSGCGMLDKIDIPEGVATISPSVFDGCRSARVHLSSTVKEFLPLKTYGRGWYTSHIEMKELTVSPDNPVLSIEENCLVDKQKRELLHILDGATAFPADLKSINITDNCLPPLLDVEELVIPASVTHISTLPFDRMKKLKKLVLPVTLQSFDKGFLNDYPFSSISVSPDLLLSDAFEPWQDFCRADLVGVDSVRDDLKKKIAKKFPVGRWTKQILCVYVGDQLIYPAASVVKAKKDEKERASKMQAISSLDQEKQEVAEKVEDVTLKSLCDTVFPANGFDYSYSAWFNTISVSVLGLLKISRNLQLETARDDLAVILDAATSFRQALGPYVSASPDVSLKCFSPSEYRESGLHQEGMKFVSGNPFPDTCVYLKVEKNSVESAFQALENLETAYKVLSQKYGERLAGLSYNSVAL